MKTDNNNYKGPNNGAKPIQLNAQLAQFAAGSFGQQLHTPDSNPEIVEQVEHLNELLERLQTAIAQLRNYSSQVAHELRTPLQLMQLQVELNASKMEPELAGALQGELARLSKIFRMAGSCGSSRKIVF